MPNIYFVKTVKADKVVGLAVGEGDKFISTTYAHNGQVDAAAPTTIADLQASIKSGDVPVPPAGVVADFIGITEAHNRALLTQQVGEDIYLEHALAV